LKISRRKGQDVSPLTQNQTFWKKLQGVEHSGKTQGKAPRITTFLCHITLSIMIKTPQSNASTMSGVIYNG